MTMRINENSKISIEESMINTESDFTVFQTNISKEKIINLNKEFKKLEKKGYINYTNFIQSMKNVFDDKKWIKNDMSNISINSYDDIYNLFFKRFREIKCIIKNDKEIFYLTDLKKENYISTYKAIYALIVFLLAKFDVKLELIFNVTDLDEDGLLNKNEIKQMITTVNHLFVEETNTVKMNSSILSQSLTNIKVENILKELFEGEGDLNNIIDINGNYIDYNTFYKRIKKIKNYKYKIIPCFVNFKECLFNKKKENILKVKSKLRKDFINISSFMAEQSQSFYKNFKIRKKYSRMDISDLIQPVEYDEKNTNNEKTFMKSSMNLKSLMKNYSTIFDNNNNISNYNCNYNDTESFRFNSTNYKNTKFAFQANYSDIRNIEVEPGVVQILSEEVKQGEDNDNINNMTILDTNELFIDKKESSINNNNISNIDKDSLISSKKQSKKNIFNQKNRYSINPFSIINESKKNNNALFNSKASKRSSLFLSLRKNKCDISNLNNCIKKTKIYKMNNRYKTFEEIMKEIKSQENVFNNESINFIHHEMVKESNNTESMMKNFKNSFVFRSERPKRSSSFCGILYYNKKGTLPQILSKKKT